METDVESYHIRTVSEFNLSQYIEYHVHLKMLFANSLLISSRKSLYLYYAKE